MPNALEAMKTLLDEVKSTFGDHGELANEAHPLYKPVHDMEQALKQLELLTAEQDVPSIERRIVNPDSLTVVVEQVGGTALSPSLTFRFSEDGMKVEVSGPGESDEPRSALLGWMSLIGLVNECQVSV